MIKQQCNDNKRNRWKNIALNKAGLTHEIHDLDIKYVKITCLSCVLNHEIMIIR